METLVVSETVSYLGQIPGTIYLNLVSERLSLPGLLSFAIFYETVQNDN